MIYENSVEKKLKPSDFNIKGSKGQETKINDQYASILDYETFIFSRPTNRLPSFKRRDNGAKHYKMNQKGVFFDTVYSIVVEGNPVMVRYAVGPILDGNGKRKGWNPEMLSFSETGKMSVNAKRQPDLWFWMYNNPRCVGGPNWEVGNKPLFFLEDPAAAERGLINKFELEMEIILALKEMSNEQAQKLCTAFNRTGIKEELAKPTLRQIASEQPEKLFKAIRKMTGTDSEVYDLVSQLDSKNIAAYRPDKKAWHKLKGNRSSGELLLKVNSGQDPTEAMIDFLSNASNALVFAELSQILRDKNSQLAMDEL